MSFQFAPAYSGESAGRESDPHRLQAALGQADVAGGTFEAAVLKQKGIVASEVRGNRRVYSIVDPFIREIVGSLMADPMAIPEEALEG